MKKAVVKAVESGPAASCPSCGSRGRAQLALVAENGHQVWRGCDLCLAMAIRRGQEETLRQLCRLADRPAPERNESALY